MNPAVKYTLGRIGLFVAVMLALWPIDLNIFVKLMLALAFSAALSFFLLRGWRDEMAQRLAEAAQRRRVERDRLRSALAGDDRESSGPTPPAGSGDAQPPAGSGPTPPAGSGDAQPPAGSGESQPPAGSGEWRPPV